MSAPVLLNTSVTISVADYNGADDRYPVTSALEPNGKFHCSKEGKNFDLLLELSEPCTITHFVARGPGNCTEPIKTGAVWFSSERPANHEEYSKAVEGKSLEELQRAEGLAKKPDLVFETDGVFYEYAGELQSHAKGVKFVHIKYVDTRGEASNVDVEFFGLVGFKGEHSGPALGLECLQELNAEGVTVVNPKPKKGVATDLGGSGYNFNHLWYKPCLIALLPAHKCDDQEGKHKREETAEHKALIAALHGAAAKSDQEALNVFYVHGTDELLEKFNGDRFFGVESSGDLSEPQVYFLVKDKKKYKLANVSAHDADAIAKFAADALADKHPRHIRSKPEPADDADPAYPGMTIVVGSSFDRIVLDPDTDVFLDVWAPWCGPCVAAAPEWSALAETLQQVGALGKGKLLIAKCDCNDNDTNKEYITEGGIPNFKLFPKGDREHKKDKAVRYKGDRSLNSFLSFVHEHMSEPKFDLEAALDKAKVFNRKAEAMDKARRRIATLRRPLKPLESEYWQTAPEELKAAQAAVRAKWDVLDDLHVKEAEADVLEAGIAALEEALESTGFEEKMNRFIDRNVKSLASQQEFEAVTTAKDGKLSSIHFWGPWCGPCMDLAPFYGQMSEKYSEARFFKAECDVPGTEWIDELQLDAVPYFMFFKNGEQVDKYTDVSKEALEDVIKKHI